MITIGVKWVKVKCDWAYNNNHGCISNYGYTKLAKSPLRVESSGKLTLALARYNSAVGVALQGFFIKPKLSIEYDEKKRDIFARELKLIDSNGKLTGITQKYLLVCVRNTGGAVAHRCKAELQVTKWDKSTRPPSNDPKPLTWGGPTLEKDIGAKGGNELLHVVFSDSRLSSAPSSTPDLNIYALVSTMESLYPRAPFIRAQDGFGIGSFEAELAIISEEGSSVKSTLRINVAKDFRALSMEKLS